jgi:signal transduction histidine kinase
MIRAFWTKGKWPLARKLMAQLMAVYVGGLVLAICGLLAVGGYFNVLAPFQANEQSANILADALLRAPDGSFYLGSSPTAEELTRSSGSWYLISSPGQQIAHGEVPRDLTDVLLGGSLRRADLSGQNVDNALSSFLIQRRIDGQEVTIITGGSPVLEGLALYLVAAKISLWLLIPIFFSLCLVTFLVLPWVVKRSMAGIGHVVQLSGKIDLNRPGTQFPTGVVPQDVEPLIQAFNCALLRIDEAYERQQRFLAQAAHELRTPIAILQARLESAPASPLRDRALQDTARLGTLAGQLLDLQRLGKRPDHVAVVDLVLLGQEIVADLAPLSLSSGYDIAFSSAAHTVPVRADKVSIQRAVSNLIINAICHAEGMTTIWVNISSAGLVTVEDDGAGIPEEERERVFEPFHRLNSAPSGSGLGLSLVREVALLHGGSVHIAPRSPQGTCVVLNLSASMIGCATPSDQMSGGDGDER